MTIYKCKFCNKTYKRENAYKEHIKSCEEKHLKTLAVVPPLSYLDIKMTLTPEEFKVFNKLAGKLGTSIEELIPKLAMQFIKAKYARMI